MTQGAPSRFTYHGPGWFMDRQRNSQIWQCGVGAPTRPVVPQPGRSCHNPASHAATRPVMPTTRPITLRPSQSCRDDAVPADRRFVGTGSYPGPVTEESSAPAGAQERFENLVDELAGTEGVTPPRRGSGFGRAALRFQGKIFAMHVRGALVLKLPAERVEALVRAGEGIYFDANKGTPMKEWLSLDPGSSLQWLPLASEALDFARSARRPGSRR
jgi:hypothetical protein